MEFEEAKTIIRKHRRISYDYLASEYNMNIYRGCSATSSSIKFVRSTPESWKNT